MLIIFSAATNAANYRLIFSPLNKLGQSLTLLRENHNSTIYGIERDDELGQLSNTIRELFYEAHTDALTGIYNRRFMETQLDQAMVLLSRNNGMLSVLMLDIDYFKRYNDTYGHDQGDKCLMAVAKAISGNIARASDFAARYGGEEFIAVLPNTDEAGACLMAERIMESVKALEIPHPANEASKFVTVSIGVTTGNADFNQQWDDYVKIADAALYQSKEHGRNRYTYLPAEFTSASNGEAGNP
jgi:diguanylate cyclase (GGDEF)-like protein